jgi:hypothetical protein
MENGNLSDYPALKTISGLWKRSNPNKTIADYFDYQRKP